MGLGFGVGAGEGASVSALSAVYPPAAAPAPVPRPAAAPAAPTRPRLWALWRARGGTTGGISRSESDAEGVSTEGVSDAVWLSWEYEYELEDEPERVDWGRERRKAGRGGARGEGERGERRGMRVGAVEGVDGAVEEGGGRTESSSLKDVLRLVGGGA